MVIRAGKANEGATLRLHDGDQLRAEQGDGSKASIREIKVGEKIYREYALTPAGQRQAAAERLVWKTSLGGLIIAVGEFPFKWLVEAVEMISSSIAEFDAAMSKATQEENNQRGERAEDRESGDGHIVGSQRAASAGYRGGEHDGHKVSGGYML